MEGDWEFGSVEMMLSGLGQTSTDSSVWQGFLDWFDPPTVPSYGVNVPASAFSPGLPASYSAAGIVTDPNAAAELTIDPSGALASAINSNACPSGTTVNAAGQCITNASSSSTWLWIAVAAGAALIVGYASAHEDRRN